MPLEFQNKLDLNQIVWIYLRRITGMVSFTEILRVTSSKNGCKSTYVNVDCQKRSALCLSLSFLYQYWEVEQASFFWPLVRFLDTMGGIFYNWIYPREEKATLG